MKKKVTLVGLSHHTAPVEVREKVAFENAALRHSLERLMALPSVEEGLILSTCNRVEVLAVSVPEAAVVEEIKGFLAGEEAAGNAAGLEEHLYALSDGEAVKHLFRVAASLDSMVVGEPQILGQLKDYYLAARDAGTVGSVLHRLFHRSFSVAKRVRTETGIAVRPVSVSSVAVDLAKRIFDRLEGKTVMVIGAGRIGELVARHLVQNGVTSLMITNRTFERAVELAEGFRASPIRFDDFQNYLKLADVVIGSTESPQFLLGAEAVAEALKERKQKAMFFIDLGVPRNFDPAINGVDNAYLYHIDDLDEVSRVNLQGRHGETVKAEAIVEEEVGGFLRWLDSLEHVPTIVALKRRFEDIRQQELLKSLSTTLKDLSDRDRRALEDMTSAMMNKILHSPLVRIKSEPTEETRYLDALKRLFNVEEKDEDEEEI